MQAGYTKPEIDALQNYVNVHEDNYGEFPIPGTDLTVLQAIETNAFVTNGPGR